VYIPQRLLVQAQLAVKILRKELNYINTNCGKLGFNRLGQAEPWHNYIRYKHELFYDAFDRFPEQEIINTVFNTGPSHLFKSGGIPIVHHSPRFLKDYMNPALMENYEFYLTSISPKAVNYNLLSLVPGPTKISNLAIKNTWPNPSGLLEFYPRGIELFKYPYFYRLHNNYVVTVDSENTVLFDMDKVQRMYNGELLRFLNPLNPTHGFKGIEDIPRPNFLIYEAKFEEHLFNRYTKLKNDDCSIPDLTTMQLALDQIIELTY